MVTQQMNNTEAELKRKSFFNEATIGKCDRKCKNFIVFIGLTIVSVLLGFVGSTPHKIMVLRLVTPFPAGKITKITVWRRLPLFI